MQSGLQLWGCCTALLAAQLATAPAPCRESNKSLCYVDISDIYLVDSDVLSIRVHGMYVCMLVLTACVESGSLWGTALGAAIILYFTAWSIT